MPKLIVGNVDNENMVGDVSKLSSQTQSESARVAKRLIWLVEPGDIILLPRPMSPEHLDYVCHILGIDKQSFHVFTPEIPENENANLTFDVLSQPVLIKKLKSCIKNPDDWEVLPYFYDRSIVWLANELNIPSHAVNNEFFRQGGAEQFNSKAHFRCFATGHKIPIAEGAVCNSKRELFFAAKKFIDATGTIIIKQDRQAGGDGNCVITKTNMEIAIGATAVYKVKNEKDLEETVDKIWNKYVDKYNTCVVMEVYYNNKNVYYTELLIPHLYDKPVLLNFGEMRMRPLWQGFDIPGRGALDFAQLAQVVFSSAQLFGAVSQAGFVGKLNCDVVLTDQDKIFFTEINGRLGGCTHIDVLARNLLGDNYLSHFVLLTDNKFPCKNFNEFMSTLKKNNLDFTPEKKSGVILLVDDSVRNGVAEYVVIGHDDLEAAEIENKLVELVE